MSLSKELGLAILAMDAYNHGTNPAVKDVGNSLGIAEVVPLSDYGFDDTKTDEWNAAGFSATVYELTATVGNLPQGTIVISYRGTDSVWGSPAKLWEGRLPTDGDLLNAYGLAVGMPTASQGKFAIELFKAVQETAGNGVKPVLTGHSLGGDRKRRRPQPAGATTARARPRNVTERRHTVRHG